jgi:D-cysteine desulfhydrase
MTKNIFEEINKINFISILHAATPLEFLSNSFQIPNEFKESHALDQHAKIFIKRDDLTPGFGNKTRKLEYLLSDAKKLGCDCVITAGGPQSNHCRQTAQFARSIGLEAHLVFGTKSGLSDYAMVGNPFIDQILSAAIHTCRKPDRSVTMQALAEELNIKGKKPYVIPVGGSNKFGVIAYARAFSEMLEQSRLMGVEFSKIIFASSSGGTQAGLVVGARLAGWTGEIIGISIDQVPDEEEFNQELKYVAFMVDIANSALEHLGLDLRVTYKDFAVNYDYLQDGYGVVGKFDRLGVFTLANHGILSGPVYSGRAFGALIDLVKNKRIKSEDTVLFWHTGGVGELDVYRDDLS